MQRIVRLTVGSLVAVATPLLAASWGVQGPAQAGHVVVLPDREAIPAPPCPGCQVIATLPAHAMEVNGEDVTCKPWLRAVTAEPVEKVTAFYAKELAGWKHSAQFGGMVHMFWRGEAEELEALDVAAVCTSVHVTVAAANGDEAPGARTMVEINY